MTGPRSGGVGNRERGEGTCIRGHCSKQRRENYIWVFLVGAPADRKEWGIDFHRNVKLTVVLN
jgi:hypothetical protein